LSNQTSSLQKSGTDIITLGIAQMDQLRLTRYEALALCPKSVWSSEFKAEPFAHDSHVFLADPTVEGFAQGLSTALNARVEDKADARNFTWDNYFETVLYAAEDSTR
jgi:hypothetical protein